MRNRSKSAPGPERQAPLVHVRRRSLPDAKRLHQVQNTQNLQRSDVKSTELTAPIMPRFRSATHSITNAKYITQTSSSLRPKRESHSAKFSKKDITTKHRRLRSQSVSGKRLQVAMAGLSEVLSMHTSIKYHKKCLVVESRSFSGDFR
jgi:hypothetical protein